MGPDAAISRRREGTHAPWNAASVLEWRQHPSRPVWNLCWEHLPSLHTRFLRFRENEWPGWKPSQPFCSQAERGPSPGCWVSDPGSRLELRVCWGPSRWIKRALSYGLVRLHNRATHVKWQQPKLAPPGNCPCTESYSGLLHQEINSLIIHQVSWTIQRKLYRATCSMAA